MIIIVVEFRTLIIGMVPATIRFFAQSTKNQIFALPKLELNQNQIDYHNQAFFCLNFGQKEI